MAARRQAKVDSTEFGDWLEDLRLETSECIKSVSPCVAGYGPLISGLDKLTTGATDYFQEEHSE